MEARQGSNSQDTAELLMVLRHHLFEVTMATCHQLGIEPGIAGEVPFYSSLSHDWEYHVSMTNKSTLRSTVRCTTIGKTMCP